MCSNNNKRNILGDLLLLAAILFFALGVFKTVRKFYLTLNKGQKKWFWVGFALLYLLGMMLG